ncbi:MAG: 3-deoxy-D-manno-octulosonic acid transferase [candidate division WOR-3 bacterium]
MALYWIYRSASRLLPDEPSGFPAEPYIWFHGASIGEANALGPLASLFADQMPVVFTSNTQAGIGAAKGFVAFRFWDNPRFVQKGLSRAKALVVAESELWPNLLLTAKRNRVPAFLANARVNRGTRRWLAARWLLSEMLLAFTEIYPKDETEARKIIELGAPEERVVYLGGLKFDSLANTAHGQREDFGFSDSLPLVVFGSVRSGEFRAIAEAASMLEDFHLAIAPRHRNRLGNLIHELRKRGVSFRTRTDKENHGVLVFDTVGELRVLYSVSDVAFVGGTLAPYGGHNILEPAALGVPVIFGPHYENQPSEAEGLTAAGGGIIVRNATELAMVVRRLLTDEGSRTLMAQRAKDFVERNRGASGRIYKRIIKLL